MTTVNKVMLKAVRADLDAALVAIMEKHGLQKLTTGNCSFDPSAGSFTFKVEGIAEGGMGKEASRLNLEATYDAALPKVDEGFFYGGKRYVATGMNTTGSKVLVRLETNGKTYLIKRDAAKVAVAASRAAV